MAANDNPLIRIELGTNMYMTGRKKDVLDTYQAYQLYIYSNIGKIVKGPVRVFRYDEPQFSILPEPKPEQQQTHYKPKPPSTPKPPPYNKSDIDNVKNGRNESGLVVIRGNKKTDGLPDKPTQIKQPSPPKVAPGVVYETKHSEGELEAKGKRLRKAWEETPPEKFTYRKPIGPKESSSPLTLESVESPTKGGKKRTQQKKK